MTPQDIYHDFLMIRNMRASTKERCRMLAELLVSYEDNFLVVGVTEEALKVFAENDFRRVSRMGINRSHFVERKKTHTEMLEGPLLDFEAWWKLYRETDKTVLATATENMSNKFSRIIDIDTSLGLFRSAGFGWSHKKGEAALLREMHENHVM